MDEVTSIISEPTTIKPQRSPEDDPAPTTNAGMDAEEARAIIDKVMASTSDTEAFSHQSLKAAAVLKAKDPQKFAEITLFVKEGPTDTNLWKSLVKDAEREIRRKASRVKAAGRPVIIDRADLHLMVDESCAALKQLGGVYERGGELVEVVEDVDGPRIQPVQKGRVRDLLSQAAVFEQVTEDSARPIKPPSSVVDSVHARGTWELPPLKGFVDGACMLSDGDILATTGYHPEPKLYVRNGAEITGLRAPTQDGAQAAYQHLTELIADFELVEENRAAHEAAWVACLLTILARPAIEHGPTPLFLFDANRPRTGKTRMADIACLIATGRMPNHDALPGGRGADTEMAKLITTKVRTGAPIIFFDNVSGRLGGSALENAITSTRWSGRVLGMSEESSGPLMTTWIVTSNNSSLAEDMQGRTVLVRIETMLENPEERSGFRFPKIMRHAREHRDEYLKSALTILRAWHVAGRPEYDFLPLGSFEEWGEVVRNAVIFAGGPDPCESRQQMDDTNSTMDRLAAVLEAWPLGRAFKASDISHAMREGRFKGDLHQGYEDLAEALVELLPSSKAASVGTMLGFHKKKVVVGRRLIQGTGRERRMWLVEEI